MERHYHSTTSLPTEKALGKFNLTRVAKSEQVLSPRKSHPLLNYHDDGIPHRYDELVLAAETLENIVNEGSFIGTIHSSWKRSHETKAMSDRVMKLVYGTMKCNPF